MAHGRYLTRPAAEHSRHGLLVVLSVVMILAVKPRVAAEIIGGIEFPQGQSSFADQVLRYEPLLGGGPGPTEPLFLDPADALDVPDFPPGGDGGDPGAVSLGRGGLLELLFVDNLLTNSGNNGVADLHIFEAGGAEDTFVAIRPLPATLALLDPSGDTNADGFFEIGKVFGATSSIDIDLIFPGFPPGGLQFDAVQLVDDPSEGQQSGPTVGADIDAVGAVSSLVKLDRHWLLNSNGLTYSLIITQDGFDIFGMMICLDCLEPTTLVSGTIDGNAAINFRRDLPPAGDDDGDQLYHGFLLRGVSTITHMAGVFGYADQTLDEFSFGWFATTRAIFADGFESGSTTAWSSAQ